MNNRNIPTHTQYLLLAQSCGFCENPKCEIPLFEYENIKPTYIGEQAHIVPYSGVGNREDKKINTRTNIHNIENLILLCPTCHTLVDKDKNNQYTTEILLEWKKQRQQKIDNLFAIKHKNFETLSKQVIPLLKENKEIFDAYGVENEPSTFPDKYPLWKKSEFKLLINNSKLKTIFQHNELLFSKKNADILLVFYKHVREFEDTRDSPAKRYALFPKELNSIFQIEPCIIENGVTDYDAIRKFLLLLKKENRYIDFKLFPDPIVTYKDKNSDTIKTLSLNDSHNLDQILWNSKSYIQNKPKSDKTRLPEIIYACKLLYNIDSDFIFDPFQITATFKNKNIKFTYTYTFSESDFYELENKENIDIIVNLHEWGNSSITKEAIKVAKKYRINLLKKSQFLASLYNE